MSQSNNDPTTAPSLALPPLPEPFGTLDRTGIWNGLPREGWDDVFSAEQMEAYARESCRKARRAALQVNAERERTADPVAVGEITRAANVIAQCRATARHEIGSLVMVDGGSGSLRELLTDAADVIEAYTAPPAAAPRPAAEGVDLGDYQHPLETMPRPAADEAPGKGARVFAPYGDGTANARIDAYLATRSLQDRTP